MGPHQSPYDTSLKGGQYILHAERAVRDAVRRRSVYRVRRELTPTAIARNCVRSGLRKARNDASSFNEYSIGGSRNVSGSQAASLWLVRGLNCTYNVDEFYDPSIRPVLADCASGKRSGRFNIISSNTYFSSSSAAGALALPSTRIRTMRL